MNYEIIMTGFFATAAFIAVCGLVSSILQVMFLGKSAEKIAKELTLESEEKISKKVLKKLLG